MTKAEAEITLIRTLLGLGELHDTVEVVRKMNDALHRARPHVALTKSVARGDLYPTCYMDLRAIDELLDLQTPDKS